LPTLVQRRVPRLYRFADDGKTPNNLYRGAVRRRRGFDPAAMHESLFAANGWKHSWRDGIYDFLYFHTGTHEALGIVRRKAKVQAT